MQLVQVLRDGERVPVFVGDDGAEQELWSYAHCWELGNGWSEFAGRLQAAPPGVGGWGGVAAADESVGEAAPALGVQPPAFLFPAEALILD